MASQAEVEAAPMELKAWVLYRAVWYGMGIGFICGALVGVAYAMIMIRIKG